MANDILTARPVPDDGIADYYVFTRSYIAEKRALLIRLNRVLAVAVFGLLAVCVAEAAALAYLMPLKQLVPFIIAVNSDGSHDVLTNIHEFAPAERATVTRAILWNYVKLREEYILQGAPTRYYAVSDMSTAVVRRDYQNWFASMDGPQSAYGQGRLTDVMTKHVTDLDGDVQFTSDHSADISFWRIEELGGVVEKKQRVRASVGFALNATIQERDVDNDPIGLVITSYHSRCETCGGN